MLPAQAQAVPFQSQKNQDKSSLFVIWEDQRRSGRPAVSKFNYFEDTCPSPGQAAAGNTAPGDLELVFFFSKLIIFNISSNHLTLL